MRVSGGVTRMSEDDLVKTLGGFRKFKPHILTLMGMIMNRVLDNIWRGSLSFAAPDRKILYQHYINITEIYNNE